MEDEECVPLIDVLSIIYLGYQDDVDDDDEELELVVPPEKQCGVIKICSDSGVQYVYKVDVPDMSMSPIRTGDHIPVTLKVPTSSSWEDCIQLKYDLFDGAYQGTEPLDWNPMFPCDEAFIRELTLDSSDGYGEILVVTGQYGNGTVAQLEVTLNVSDNTTEVYGVIGATNSRLDYPLCTSVLFLKKPENAIRVGGKGGVIPLCKSHVAVPLKSVLYVDFSLSFNGCDHTGSLSFDAQKQGESTQCVDDGIQVKVSWFNDEDKICNMYDEVIEGPTVDW